MNFHPQGRPRNLILILGDQLNLDSGVFDHFDLNKDAVWMAEVSGESTHVWSHQARIALFLSAMRHFRDELLNRGITVHYRQLNDSNNYGTLATELSATISRLCPQRLIVIEPGEWRVAENLKDTACAMGLELEVLPDRHFLCSREEFANHAKGRKQLRMEFFYREMRQRTGVLMTNGKPMGGSWNFDAENRNAFGKSGPGPTQSRACFVPDATTLSVIKLVREKFSDHPGSLDAFDWPVTRADAQRGMADFIAHRLPLFGAYQDAMWTGEPSLYHSRLSAALNLKLLNPREVIAHAEKALKKGHAPLAAVEGFIRQILGWREYVRGIYWRFMPEYAQRNGLQATRPLPNFYWSGDTEMNCLHHTLRQTLDLGYAHHIQRLMVTGLYALLLGVKPQFVHEWYLSVYVDAVEWVELPNTLGMSQFADGGIMASKPYVASGKYIQRMSNYCAGCRYDPGLATGERACPFTTLYWDFLLRHEATLRGNQRMAVQLRNLSRLDSNRRAQIRQQAEKIKNSAAQSAKNDGGII